MQFRGVKTFHLVQFILCDVCVSNPTRRLYNREIGGLIKGAVATGCKNLTLIMMSGETGDINIDGLTVHCVLATQWLLGSYKDE